MQVPQSHTTSSRKLATTSACYLTIERVTYLKNFGGAAVRFGTHSSAQMARFLRSGGTGDKEAGNDFSETQIGEIELKL